MVFSECLPLLLRVDRDLMGGILLGFNRSTPVFSTDAEGIAQGFCIETAES